MLPQPDFIIGLGRSFIRWRAPSFLTTQGRAFSYDVIMSANTKTTVAVDVPRTRDEKATPPTSRDATRCHVRRTRIPCPPCPPKRRTGFLASGSATAEILGPNERMRG